MPGSYINRVPKDVLRAHRIVGVLQIFVAIAVFVLTIIGSATRQDYYPMTSGFWAGPFIFVAGLTGLSAAKGKCNTLACVISCMIFSIISSCLAFIAMIVDSVTAASNMSFYSTRSNSGSDGLFRACYASGILCALLFIFEFVLALVHSVYACRASCCCLPKAAPAESQPHMAYLPQGQTVLFVQQQQVQVALPQPQPYPYPPQQPTAPYNLQVPYSSPAPQVAPEQYVPQPEYNPNFTPDLPPSYEQAMAGSGGQPRF